ncbi:hypothetical protein C8J55DRAFT_435582 [Lentinula edodes]|uniref:Uncharacterized protein n=1 Tax=Lentinula lateritia TaxID=40482 RepID=A0A9W9DHP3_9AGAR|nr:hypothetical protein C8J55DRAFT_435582 [Lentinula edodes]
MHLPPTHVLAAIVPTRTIIVDQNLATLAQQTEPDITALVLQTFLYGIYASIALPTVLTLVERQPRSKPWFFLLVSTIVMFLLSTICMVLEVVNTMGVLEGIKLETQGAFQPPTAWYGFRGANDRTLVQATIFSLEFILGDAIVVWRASALWAFDWKIMFSMIIVLLGDFGQADWWYIAGTQPKSCNVSQRAMFLLSFGTNAIATFFIALKAWQHREAFIALPDSLSSSGSWKKSRSPAQKIMILFLESGFLYMLFWVSSPTFFMTDIFNQTRYQVVGLYPTAIILLIHRERSSWDTPEISTSLRTSFKAAAPTQYDPPMKQESKQISTFGISTIDRSSIISITEPHIIKEVDNPKLAKSWSSHLSDIGPSSPNVEDNTSQISLACPLRSEPLALVDHTATHRAHGRSLSDETIAVTE